MDSISGTHLLRVMRDHPQIWDRVWGVSRRPALEEFPEHITSLAVDLLENSPEQIAEDFKKAGVKDMCV